MKYNISYQNPSTHYIDISVEVITKGKDQVRFQLPAWRPGRYELGNFAKNIQKWAAYDSTGKALKHRKITKDLWEVESGKSEVVRVEYNYFANELNAGSSFLSGAQLYVNPVNCMLYAIGYEEEPCEVKIDIPEDYKVAIALSPKMKNIFIAKNFDELADSPFIASSTLQHHEFKVEGTNFHLWFQGVFKPDWELLEKDFSAYTKEQIKLFGGFPMKEYHYLFQILPHSAYHGVEHSASTVIALGPSYSLLKKEGRYEDLLGVSSHELFHTWNVKRIRPVEMVPYDFTKENYNRLGYLSEGATTWYGDLMLYRSSVFNDTSYFKTFNQLLDRHYNNPGVKNLSVADSSFDTWLDGYVMGVPNRKSSIYTEGALITFLLDVEIRKSTNNEKSFDDVLRSFYNDYYLLEKGISEEDYKKVVEEIAGKSLDDFFDKYINGVEDYSQVLTDAMNYLGLKRDRLPSQNFQEAYLGIRVAEGKVISIFPGSPAEQGGLSIHDEIVIINGIKVNNDLSEWLEYFKDAPITMGAFDKTGQAKRILVELSEEFYYSRNVVSWKEELSVVQQEARDKWRKTN